jgi:hypothetical protein
MSEDFSTSEDLSVAWGAAGIGVLNAASVARGFFTELPLSAKAGQVINGMDSTTAEHTARIFI